MTSAFEHAQAMYDAAEPDDSEEDDVRPTLYDDTYTGPRWRYGLEHRPLTNYFNVGSFPDPILFSNRPDPRFPYHGTAEWPCRIPIEEARHHSLVLVEWPDDECGPDSATELLERGPR